MFLLLLDQSQTNQMHCELKADLQVCLDLNDVRKV